MIEFFTSLKWKIHDKIYNRAPCKRAKWRIIFAAIFLSATIQILLIWVMGAIKPLQMQEGLGTGASDAVSITLGADATLFTPDASSDAPHQTQKQAPLDPLQPPAAQGSTGEQAAKSSAALISGGGQVQTDDLFARASLPGAANATEDKLKLAGNIPAQVRVCWVKAGSGGAIKLSLTLNDHGALMGEPVAAGPASPAALAAAVDAAKACAPYALGPAPGLMQTFEVELGGR